MKKKVFNFQLNYQFNLIFITINAIDNFTNISILGIILLTGFSTSIEIKQQLNTFSQSGLSEKQNSQNLTPEMQTVMQDAIDSAYQYYGKKVLNNAKFIRSKLEISLQLKWNVIIVTETTKTSLYKDVGFSSFWSQNGDYYAYWTNANKYENGWTYIMTQARGRAELNVTGPIDKQGSEFSDEDVGAIKFIIWKAERTVPEIQVPLLNIYKYKWPVSIQQRLKHLKNLSQDVFI